MPTTVETKPERVVAQARERPSLVYLASLTITLFLFWFVLSGYFTAFLLAAGIGCALSVAALANRMHLLDAEGHPIELSIRAVLGYWPWLLKEIFKSALQVSWVVLHPKLPIRPTLVRFKPSQRSDLALVVHANSITLTPGTICIEAGPDEFLVHALTEAGAAGVGTHSDMDRRVARLEHTE